MLIEQKVLSTVEFRPNQLQKVLLKRQNKMTSTVFTLLLIWYFLRLKKYLLFFVYFRLKIDNKILKNFINELKARTVN